MVQGIQCPGRFNFKWVTWNQFCILLFSLVPYLSGMYRTEWLCFGPTVSSLDNYYSVTAVSWKSTTQIGVRFKDSRNGFQVGASILGFHLKPFTLIISPCRSQPGSIIRRKMGQSRAMYQMQVKWDKRERIWRSKVFKIGPSLAKET